MSRTIAIVEDDQSLAAQYAEAMRADQHQVRLYPSCASAREGLGGTLPDLVLLDVGLPEGAEAGFDLCRELRARTPSLPILFLTARDDEIDLISGLRLGADDYLTKDISLRQLRARVNTALARLDRLQAAEPEEPEQHIGALRIHHQRMQASYGGQALELTLTEFAILCSLTERPGHVRSRDQLMETADLLVDLATITSYVKRLRKKLVEIDPAFDRIESVYGYGYRWKDG